jgi:hypothetical protein
MQEAATTAPLPPDGDSAAAERTAKEDETALRSAAGAFRDSAFLDAVMDEVKRRRRKKPRVPAG